MATGNMQPVGKAVIVYGTVKAVSVGGFERILTPNSVIYAHERIVTGPDGSVSIAFIDNPAQLVLGRMSDVAVDEDVYAHAAHGVVGDSIAQVHDIQTALQQDGNFDPTVDLPPPAADGGVAGTAARGGGRQIVIFTADHMEVTPDSGAETRGIGLTFLDPPPGALPNEENSIVSVGVNDAPVAVNDSLIGTEDTARTITATELFGADGVGSINDSDADSSTFTSITVTELGTNGTLQLNGVNVGLNQVISLADITDGHLSFLPNADFNGEATFKYTVSDGTLSSNVATVTIGFAGVNDAPVAVNDSLIGTEDTARTITATELFGADGVGSINDSDADSSTFTSITVTELGTNGTLQLNGVNVGLNQVISLADITDGHLSFLPNADFNGEATFKYTVSDGTLSSNVATVTIGFAGVNDAPVAVNDSLIGTEDTARTITATELFGADGVGSINDSDADSSTFTSITVTELGTNGTLQLNGVNVGLNQVISLADITDGHLSFLPNADFNGEATFKYTVSDGTLSSNVATVTIGFAGVNDAPVAVNDSLIGTEDTARTITATELFGADGVGSINDSDADSSTFTSITVTELGTNGTLQLNGVNVGLNQVISLADITDGHLSFLPNADFNGEATFKYTVSDGTLSSNVATVTIGFAGVNDAPTVALWNDSNDNGTFEAANDNQAEIVTVTIATGSNLPNTQDIFVGDSLSGGIPLTASQLANNPPVTTVLTHTADVTITFLSEGAGYQDTVGWYDVNNPTVGHVIWANASAVNSDGNLVPGGSSVTISNVPAGTQLGFFLIPDGYSPDSGPNTLPADGTVYFKDGKAYADANFTQLVNSTDNNMDGNANPTWFSNSPNNDGLQHAIAGVAMGDSNTLYVGFEDLGNGGDKDYDDVVFKVDLGEGNTIQINPATFDVGVTIQDPDSANMSQAVLSFVLGAGDTVSYNTLAVVDGLHVTVDDVNHIYTIAGDASIATYNTLLDSFHIAVGHSGANQNYLDIDPLIRTADLQVWDASGTVSAHETAHFDLQLNIVGSTGNEGLVGGAGDDILTGGAGADHIDGGNGSDTVSYVGSTAGVTVTLHGASAADVSGGDATGDIVTNVENITGSAHNDVLTGDSGNNVLDGRAGDDHLTGGTGVDTFKVGEGHDTIMDYTAGEKIDISDVLNSPADDNSRLGLLNDGGKAEVAIYDNAAHDNVIGSVTFDNIDLHPGDTLNTLLGQIDLDHTK